MIAEDVRLGNNVLIYHPDLVNLYGCEIGDETKIGAFVEIRRTARIGKNVKVQAFAFIPEGVTIEEVLSKVEKTAKSKVDVKGNTLVIEPAVDSRRKLKKLIGKILDKTIKGVKGIKKTIIVKEGNEYVIKTEGTNLKKILKMKGVDPTRTVSNDIHEIAEVLGIEAARNAIIKEAMNVLEEQGLIVDIRHIMLVADAMTFYGEIKPIGRYGITGEKRSVLARAAFEATVSELFDAAVRGEVDTLEGVTESVVTGQKLPIGTGAIELYVPQEGIYGGKKIGRG